MATESRTSELCDVRVVSTYSTSWHFLGSAGDDLREYLKLDELTRHYELYKNQLPRLLPSGVLGELTAKEIKFVNEQDGVRFADEHDGVENVTADARLFALPSNQVVLAVTLAFRTRPLADEAGVAPIAKVLELAVDSDITINNVKLADHIAGLRHKDLRWNGRTGSRHDDALLPERHLLVFVSRRGEEDQVPSRAVVRKILYRKSPPYREEFGLPKRPGQLNLLKDTGSSESDTRCALRPDTDDGDLRTLGVVTPYVSLLYGHENYIEDSIFLSTVHAVGTATVFRQIWHEAYRRVRQFREKKQEQRTGLQTRGDLEELADRLGNLEFDLTFSVEFPLMRIETFKTDLYEAMDLSNQASALSQMFEQLDGSLRSEITAIDVRERRRDERRQKWNAFAAGVLSLIGVSVGFVIAFLGINTTQVPDGTGGRPKASMWDAGFADVYLLAALFALSPTFLIAFPHLRDWAERRAARDRRHTGGDGGARSGGGDGTTQAGRPERGAAGRAQEDNRPGDRRALWYGLMVAITGAAGMVAALADRPAHVWRIVDYILLAIAAFAVLLGASLAGLWAWATRQEIKKRAVEREEERRAAEEERRAAEDGSGPAPEKPGSAGRDPGATEEGPRPAEEKTASA